MATLEENHSANAESASISPAAPAGEAAVAAPIVDEKDAVKELSEYLASLNTNLCDHFEAQLQQAFEHVVETILPEEGGVPDRRERALERFNKAYMQNVDRMEGYVSRNIFTLHNLPPNRRARIAQIFQSIQGRSNNNPDEKVEITLELDEPEFLKIMDDDSKLPWEGMEPNKPVQQAHVQQAMLELKDLHAKVAKAKQRKSALERQAQEIDLVKQETKWLLKAGQDDIASKIQQFAPKLVEDVNTLKDCREQGDAALKQAEKRRMENAENEAESDLALGETMHQPTNSVKEFYQKERKRFKETSTEELKQLHQMLLANKSNNENGNV